MNAAYPASEFENDLATIAGFAYLLRSATYRQTMVKFVAKLKEFESSPYENMIERFVKHVNKGMKLPKKMWAYFGQLFFELIARISLRRNSSSALYLPPACIEIHSSAALCCKASVASGYPPTRWIRQI